MQSPVAYVIMPFSSTRTHTEEEWKQVFETIFKPAFDLFGFHCTRSDVKSGSILQNIINHIHQASVVFTDLTDARPNVLYELGVAHTITKHVIMASQRIEDCPSDLNPYGVIQYKSQPNHEDTVRFQSDLKESLQKLGNETILTSPILQYVGKTMHSLEALLMNPVAIMQCVKCGLKYEVRVNETTQSDWGVDAVDNRSKRTHPIGIEHQRKRLCGHWECSRFLGIKDTLTGHIQ